jgi:ABC-2 type transport system ATP-binding protein
VEVLGAGSATPVPTSQLPDAAGAGPSAHVAVHSAAQPRAWRIRALDLAALQAALQGLDRRAEPAGRDSVEVQVASDADAADLLARLVADGVRVVAYQPATGALEQAYLSLTEDRR